MDETAFRLSGREVRLTRHDIIERMSQEEPEPIQQWAVDVEGRWFPVKQVLAKATGVPRADFISHRARDILRRLRFRVVDMAAEGGLPPATGQVDEGTTREHGDDDALRVRLAVLPLAVELTAGRPDRSVSDVTAVAEELEAWVTR